MMADVLDFPEPDEDDCDFYGDAEDDEDYDTFDCGMDRRGQCGKAGSEECDWECPFNRRGLRVWRRDAE